MAPLIALIAVTLAARLAGLVGIDYVGTWPDALAVGLAGMFLLAASAHATPSRRAGLIAIVPPAVPFPSAMVTATGALEAAGALGVLVPPAWIPGIRPLAALCLAVLLLVMFPANVYAARARRHPNAPNTPLPTRTVLQLVFLAATVTVAATAS